MSEILYMKIERNSRVTHADVMTWRRGRTGVREPFCHGQTECNENSPVPGAGSEAVCHICHEGDRDDS